MISGRNMALDASATRLNGAAPRCGHLDGLTPVVPLTDACRACQDQPGRQGRQGRLVVCLTCGWVACSDDSPGRHARAHYEETDHPVAASLPPGPARRWCYVHQRLV